MNDWYMSKASTYLLSEDMNSCASLLRGLLSIGKVSWALASLARSLRQWMKPSACFSQAATLHTEPPIPDCRVCQRSRGLWKFF